MNLVNFFIMKLLIKVRYANIINIINDKEVIPELLQSECSPKEIFNSVVYHLKNPDLAISQLKIINKTLKNIKSKNSSSDNAVKILSHYL